jgi:hypothetical protein
MTVTNHVAEIAVPAQDRITVRLNNGEIEIGQECQGVDNFVFIQPENLLKLVRAMFVLAGEHDLYLFREAPGGGCCDVDWPDGPFSPAQANRALAHELTETGQRPKDATAAERMKRYRARKKQPTVTQTVTQASALALSLVAAE